ncbi:glycosyltransferase [Nonlabens xiamenensis]|uniref:glycosyltransferase n=1 Tax=Nonlabens xiamenensis TaxID=2341043 RepID=UPI000F606C8A|nr:glycosyltransferase [Nonlabens xiamenensis]
MRSGVNPVKGGKPVIKAPCDHRVVIPLFIPHENDYFKDAYKIFELCLGSLLKTSTSALKISIISNNCSPVINERLIKLYEQKEIDELIIEREGIGKINSVLKAIRTAEERLITITDADVLFLNNWEQEVVRVFKAFPRAGAVCPVPVYRKQFDLTHNIWKDYLFSNKLKFSEVKDKDALENFAKSIGWKYLPEEFGDSIATLESKNGLKAVVGCSHFVATYKREVFEALPERNSPYLIDGDSEYLYLDKPVILSNGYRLSTYSNNAYHLGNVHEEWMSDAFEQLDAVSSQFNDYSSLDRLEKNAFKYWLDFTLFKKLFKTKKFLRWVLKKKGLNDQQIYNYLDRVY